MTNGQAGRGQPAGVLTCTTPAGELADGELLELFSRWHDEDAFAELVRRHGPMVLGVCRRVLGDAHAAEDAFQATFLVLVRRAGSLGRPESLANWLHGVAYRTAKKAQVAAARRRGHERQVAAMAAADPTVEISRQEICAVLDEELQRLPEKYRAPLVLCYLEGKTNEQAARQLGWPSGSMSARLARGREMLRERLAHRNRAVPAGVLPAILAEQAAAADVPANLAEATVRAARDLIGRRPAAGQLPPAVAALTGAVLHSLRAERLHHTAGLLAGSLALAAAALLAYPLFGGHRPDGPPEPPAPPAETAPGGCEVAPGGCGP